MVRLALAPDDHRDFLALAPQVLDDTITQMLRRCGRIGPNETVTVNNVAVDKLMTIIELERYSNEPV